MDIDKSGIEQGFEKARDGTPLPSRNAARTNADGHPNHDADPEGFGLSGYRSVVLIVFSSVSSGATGDAHNRRA